MTFYTHTTNLSTKGHAHLQMSSLRFPQLELRLPVADDAEALLHLFSDSRNVQYDKSCDGLDSAFAIDGLINQWQDVGHPLERANVVIVVDGELVGTGGIGWIGHRKSDNILYGDAGIMIDTDYRGKGYAYEALCMIIDHGFRVLGMEEVHVACVDANRALKGLMNVKLGFEATPTQDQLFGNEWIWRITKEMWHKSRHSPERHSNTGV
ncbi:acyl-CoA N-acyltransferase [Lophiotrema nucula]|uniref:Acyl-CoA N-acyltransferase n=1 Tax=Lophiotrema nucula TaxID=690887 RepID=A0A6A5YTA1_9PLEO|nr:acyl-CoA N-acyltransferase [Lophiotrema nucula]